MSPSSTEGGGALTADALAQLPEMAAPRVDSDVQEPAVEHRGGGSEDHVAGQGQVDAGADRRAGDDGDRREGTGGESLEAGVDLAASGPGGDSRSSIDPPAEKTGGAAVRIRAPDPLVGSDGAHGGRQLPRHLVGDGISVSGVVEAGASPPRRRC